MTTGTAEQPVDMFGQHELAPAADMRRERHLLPVEQHRTPENQCRSAQK
jgi:hypothetical protein